MEYVGHASRTDRLVVRGSVAHRVLTAFRVRDDVIRAGMLIDDWDAIEPIRQAVIGPKRRSAVAR